MKNGKIKVVAIIIFSLILIYTLLWFSNYKRYKDIINEDYLNIEGVYSLAIDKYTYTIKPPFYLSFTGNLAISNNESGFALIIWPKNFMEKENVYGVTLNKDGESYSFYVDNNFKYINNKENEKVYDKDMEKKIKNLINDNKNELLEMKNFIDELIFNKMK